MFDANIPMSDPGADWRLLWGNGGFENFQLDIVGFLAVLGEGSVTVNSQVSTLSSLFCLPRNLPAPQALLPVQKPRKLPSRETNVAAVQLGEMKECVHHVAQAFLASELREHEVRCVKVTKDTNRPNRAENVSSDVDQQTTKQQRWEDRLSMRNLLSMVVIPLLLIFVHCFVISRTSHDFAVQFQHEMDPPNRDGFAVALYRAVLLCANVWSFASSAIATGLLLVSTHRRNRGRHYHGVFLLSGLVWCTIAWLLCKSTLAHAMLVLLPGSMYVAFLLETLWQVSFGQDEGTKLVVIVSVGDGGEAARFSEGFGESRSDTIGN